MLIDTHSHLNIKAFELDREKTIKRCLENNVWMINIGTNYETSKRAVEIAKNYEMGVYAAVGLHPINLETGLVKMKVDEWERKHFEKDYNPPTTLPAFGGAPFDYEKYKKLAKSEKVVAIGEIGLDYYWKPKTTKKKELFKEKQKELFLKELKLTKELNLPIIFHCRIAHTDLVKILIEHQTSNIEQLQGVMHGFVGTVERLEEYLKMGFYIGFNGIIFKKIEGINFEENIRNTPLERILIETDCPYLAPPNFPVQREVRSRFNSLPLEVREERNNPLGVKYIAERIAEIKNVGFDEVAEITTENAQRLFKLG